MSKHFISDLHLDDGKPGITRILLEYLDNQAREAEALFLLGDIFEYWLGDDISLQYHVEVCDSLAAVAGAGVKLYFMHGNRDFLVGRGFCDYTGACLIEDPQVMDLNGTPGLLSHGDMLCTNDIEHQEFRELVAQPEVRARLLSLPAEQREQMAAHLRNMSKSNAAGKTMDIMDVTQATVEAAMRKYDVPLLIHGHTHRQAIHEFELDGQTVRRVVLSDWHEDRGSVLISDADGLRFKTLE